MRHKVTFTPDDRVVQFLKEELPELNLEGQNLGGPNWFVVAVWNADDQVIAALTAEFKTPFDAHISAAIADPGALSFKLLEVIFSTLFKKAKRITALVDPDNTESIARLEDLGFWYEGFLRRGLDGVRDAKVYGLLPEDCPFLARKARRRRPAAAGEPLVWIH